MLSYLLSALPDFSNFYIANFIDFNIFMLSYLLSAFYISNILMLVLCICISILYYFSIILCRLLCTMCVNKHEINNLNSSNAE